MSVTREYLLVRNVETYYETAGEGSPLLLLHGGLGTVEDFASQFSEFARYYKVIAFERSGHGHTADTDKPFSYHDMADQTVAFIDALGLGSCNLMGWSDGAAVALLVALSRPDLVRSLIYISMNLDQGGVTPRVRHWIETLTAESFRKNEPMLAKRFDEASPDGPGHFAVVLEKTKRMWLNEPNIRRDELARISVPTLIMAADKDAITIEHITEIVRAIRGAQLSVIPGATHFLLSEKPELVNMVILGFLEGVSKNDGDQNRTRV